MVSNCGCRPFSDFTAALGRNPRIKAVGVPAVIIYPGYHRQDDDPGYHHQTMGVGMRRCIVFAGCAAKVPVFV